MRQCGRPGGATGSAALPPRCRPLSYTCTDAARGRRPTSIRAHSARCRTRGRPLQRCSSRSDLRHPRAPPAPRGPPPVLEVEPFHAVDDRAGDHHPREPLGVGRHDVPRCVRCRGAADRVLVGRLVGVPVCALADVVGLELPVLLRLVQPLQEALLLLVARQVQEELEDQVAVPRKVPLDARDVLAALLQMAFVTTAAAASASRAAPGAPARPALPRNSCG